MPEIGNSSVFSQTDASNNTATDPGWPEGMAPSRVNDAARALQGAITRDWNWKGPTVTSGGTANAQTVTLTDTGTLKLAGNAVLSTTDSLTMISDGGNLIEIARSDN